MSEIIEGKLEKIKTGTTKTGKAIFWLSINGVELSYFGTPTPKMREAFDNGLRVRAGFVISTDGKYKNGVPGEFLVVSSKEPQQSLQTPTPEQQPKQSVPQATGFQTAGTIEGMDHLVGEAGRLMQASRQAFKNVYGREPATDGEMAIVNTSFIFLSKHWAAEKWLRGYEGKTIEEYLRGK